MTTLLYILLSTYLLAIGIMFLIPEEWMPKGNTTDRTVHEKGFYRKVFIIGGAIIIAIVMLMAWYVA